MKLSKYLEINKIKIEEFAAQVGVTFGTIYRYLNGCRSPRREILEKIYIASRGNVTPNDILNIPPQPEEKPHE